MADTSVLVKAAASNDTAELARKKTFERNKWLFSMGGIGRDMSYALVSSFLLVYIQFGASLTLVQFTFISLFIGVAGRIWDAVNDPLMGAIIDASHFKWGKFKPWILIGAVSCALVIVLMFNLQSLAGWSYVALICVLYLFWEATFTMNDIGYWSMLPSLSSEKKERDRVTMLTVLFAAVGAILVQGLVQPATVGDVKAGYRWFSILVAACFVLCQVMTSVFVKETPRPANEKAEKVSLKRMWRVIRGNDQILWMTLSMLFYNIGSCMFTALAANLLYMEIAYDGSLYMLVVAPWAVASVGANLLYPWLASKLGRRRLQVWSIAVACVGYAGVALFGWVSWLPFTVVGLAAMAVLISGGQSLFYMACIVNQTNCVEYNEYKHGERNEAVISTLRPFMAKFASAVQTLFVTLVLILSGVYLLSQNISSLETQRDMFAKLDASSRQSYVTTVQECLDELTGAASGTTEYDAAVADVSARLSADPVLADCQLNAEYIAALGDAMVTERTDEGAVELGRLSDVDASALPYDRVELVIGGTASGADSAADRNFRQRITLPMRIWLRAAATVVPVVFLFVSLIVQRKKFVIDEAYYDRMLSDIRKRQSASDQAID